MMRQAKTQALVDAIERRLTQISAQLHALAAEKAHLLVELTPLRLGVVAPETATAHLKAKGVTLRGLAAASPAARPPRPVVLKAVASIRPVSVAR
jgi:hypothetical protein